MNKTCSRCKEIKSLDTFSQNKWLKDGLSSFCKVCQKIENDSRREYRRTHYNAKYKSDPNYRKKRQTEARTRAANRRDEVVAYNRQWRAANLEKARFYVRNRKALRKAQTPETGGLTIGQWQEILQTFNHHCAYCRQLFTEERAPTQDHMAPLSKGGQHMADNIVPACFSCNSSKRERPLWLFAAAGL